MMESLYGESWNSLTEQEQAAALSVLEGDYWEPWMSAFVVMKI